MAKLFGILSGMTGELAKEAGKEALKKVVKYILETIKTRYGPIGLEYSMVLKFLELIPLEHAVSIENIVLEKTNPRPLGNGNYKLTYMNVDILLRILYDLADDWLGEAIITYDELTGSSDLNGPFVRKISLITYPITNTNIDQILLSISRFYIEISSKLRRKLSIGYREIYFIKIYGSEETINKIYKSLKEKLEKSDKNISKDLINRIHLREAEKPYIEIKFYPEETSFLIQPLINVLKPKRLGIV